MSNVKKSLDDLTADIRARQSLAEAVSTASWKEISALQKTQGDLTRAYIKEARLLDLCTWMLIINGSHISLSSKEDSSNPDVAELTALLETDYHCSFELVTKPLRNNPEYDYGVVSLRFDDGEIRIVFDDSKLVSGFVAEFGLKVDTTNVDEKIEVLEDTLIELRLLKKLVTEE